MEFVYTIFVVQTDYESDRMHTTRMDKTPEKTCNKMEGQPGSCVAKNSQRPASVETGHGRGSSFRSERNIGGN